MKNGTPVRLAADIGGTFTDVVLENGDDLHSIKVLTTHDMPAEAVLSGINSVLAKAAVKPEEVDLVLHGTTLATNALIERRGARTAFLTTAGFRDTIAMAHENRFEQYDIFMERPEPLVPRHLSLGIPERIAANSEELLPLDEEAVKDTFSLLEREGIESVAVGYLHSYINPRHEERTRDLIKDVFPNMSVTLSSEVCPELREYERFSTTCANAYIQPIITNYLLDMLDRFKERGIIAPLFLMLSNGGLCTVETAMTQPIGLVESGPAGGACFARTLAEQLGCEDLLSFDMGGTTAKLCLLPNGEPSISREFEVARKYRFLKGSGLPLRIPVIDMVEIGAGGGSIAGVDQLGRITVGPQSAGSEPGPACYNRGGMNPTVSDANALAGRLASDHFAGGQMQLDVNAAGDAVTDKIANPLGIELDQAVYGIIEIVDEHMANAARVHAIERGHNLTGATLVAFGGAAPLHACRLANRLGIDAVIIPAGAGVGSALGFLSAPIANEVVRTRHMRLDTFDPQAANNIIEKLRAQALELVKTAAADAPVAETRYASMRYVGQGYEIDVGIQGMVLDESGAEDLREAFETEYRRLYTRIVPGVPIEIVTWRIRISTITDTPNSLENPVPIPIQPKISRRVFDNSEGKWLNYGVYDRLEIVPGHTFSGPALVMEDQTTTVVSTDFDCSVNAAGHLLLSRRENNKPEKGGAGR
jgi:N-methylhydantoinase A